MPLTVSGQVGPQILGEGVSTQPLRQGKTAELIVQQLHGRYYEQVSRGNVYSIGAGNNALSANTITLTATTTPILGVWNPSTSLVTLSILFANLQLYINTLTTPVGSGALVWASSVGNTAISTGNSPFNRKTMVAAGSSAKGFLPSVALTGLTNNLVVFSGANLVNTTPITHGTVTAVTTQLSGGGLQVFDGSLLVPPGGVLALLNTTSTTTCSVAGELVWEEIPN